MCKRKGHIYILTLVINKLGSVGSMALNSKPRHCGFESISQWMVFTVFKTLESHLTIVDSWPHHSSAGDIKGCVMLAILLSLCAILLNKSSLTDLLRPYTFSRVQKEGTFLILELNIELYIQFFSWDCNFYLVYKI